MLLTSLPFLIGVLPLIILCVYGAQNFQRSRWTPALLFVISLAFYLYLDRNHVPLLLFSIAVNYALGIWLHRQALERPDHSSSRGLLVTAVAFNIGILLWAKYSAWFSSQPLGISFYTLAQLMYLIDCASGLVPRPPSFLNYGLFVAFFPYAYSGPIVKHEEVIPQFNEGPRFPMASERLSGWTLLAIGLLKKVVLANNLALLVGPVFEPNLPAGSLSIVSAWAGAVAFMLQLYFDFSGYSDMVIGIALILGVKLPFNFNSPLKAPSIIDFWRHWHMTLTRFLTNYIYNPLVVAIARRRVQSGKPLLTTGQETLPAFLMMTAVPTLLTMLVSGLWHGIEWKFIWLGLFHGAYLTLNHAYRILKRRSTRVPVLGVRSSQLLTFLSIVLSIVFVRAASVDHAFDVLASMVGLSGWSLHLLTPWAPTLGWLTAMLILVWCFPNSQEWAFRKDDGSRRS